ncbi:MAG: type III pantothenate kinase [Coriobacteriales bacterium]|jgi:type III pantothenate kinase|nr:type III pantothenate kinase [Coriobacteriales bacterium]
MFLAADIGNTQTTLGLFDGEDILAHWRVATIATDTADELAVRLHNLFTLSGLEVGLIDDIGIASVVPPLTKQWRLVAKRFTAHPALILDSSMDSGLVISYQSPSEIGADRIAAAVGAIALYGPPVIVVDFGTATNIEVVDRNGAFVGGIIAPGLATSAEALFRAAARLAKIDIEVPPHVIGKTTREAVQSGLTYGEIDRIDGLVRRVIDELGYPATVVATGGLSSHVVRLSDTIQVVDDNLTLKGLNVIYRRMATE